MRRGAALILAGAMLVAAGCGSDRESETPAVCLSSSSTFLDALEAAPEDVRLEGSTPISDCLVPGQEGGPLATTGQAMVEAANELNRDVRSSFRRADMVELGYLIGAVQRGAAETEGIHEDLVRRLDSAARFAGEGEVFPASFERAFGAGYAAGLERG